MARRTTADGLANALQTRVEALLRSASISFRLLDRAEVATVSRDWRRTFASKVLKLKGREVFNDYMWHGFSFGIEEAVDGSAALHSYQAQFLAPFVVFDEDLAFCLRCEGSVYPDFTTLKRDLYVAHYNMKWTIAFTHEQPSIGPFFALAR